MPQDPVKKDQSKHVDAEGRLRYSADGSEVFPGPTGVRMSKYLVRQTEEFFVYAHSEDEAKEKLANDPDAATPDVRWVSTIDRSAELV